MRGTLKVIPEGDCGSRIIPAHAGNSPLTETRRQESADHPRACGELGQAAGKTYDEAGSSPRMRGTHQRHSPAIPDCRIIPAHAGNSSSLRRRMSVSSDHPRACGELVPSRSLTSSIDGSSPRMRGTPCCAPRDQALCRIIPAHAGNSASQPARWRCRSDHPRACGELGRRCTQHHDPIGSSPRMRGTLGSETFKVAHGRIIPAHAGNSHEQTVSVWGVSDHPRACGELGA